jgi:catechol 2,3-dioxygenase-like lactoylglutathione lyase family enzyme
MSEWEKEVGAIVLFVEDLERSKAFYADVFGLPVRHEDDDSAMFRFQNTMVVLLKTGAAHELIGPAAVASPDAGSRFQLSIFTGDLDAVCAELAEKGVELINGPIDRPWGVRTVTFADPGGHIWEIAQDLPGAGGS